MDDLKRITMFKPGAKSFHTEAMDNFDAGLSEKNLEYLIGKASFKQACERYFDITPEPVLANLANHFQPWESSPKRLVLAHGDAVRAISFAAPYAIWAFLFNHMGRAFIFSPHDGPFRLVMNIILHMFSERPQLATLLEVDALSIRLRADPERRIEWVHPDTLTNHKMQKMSGCYSFVYVDSAQHFSNDFLHALSDTLLPQQSALISGVPLSAQGAFGELYRDKSFTPVKISALDMDRYSEKTIEALRQERGENSDYFRSMVLAEFPQL
ncbi:TPA: hypothetical protein ACOEOW_003845 [Enterobacter hormaechei subsp. xiangfangensis]